MTLFGWSKGIDHVIECRLIRTLDGEYLKSRRYVDAQR
jgi:hypothetical protein